MSANSMARRMTKATKVLKPFDVEAAEADRRAPEQIEFEVSFDAYAVEPTSVDLPEGELSEREAAERRCREEVSPRASPVLASLVRRLVRRRRSERAATESINAILAGVQRAAELGGLLAEPCGTMSPGGAGAIDAFVAREEGPAAPGASGAAAARNGGQAAGNGREKESP